MALSGDYHIHTKYSAMGHGKGSVEDNVAAAAAAGLKEIGISDHGMRHLTYGVSAKKFPQFLADVKAAQIKFPNMRILAGNEADIISARGDIDISAQALENIDYLIIGFHKLVKPLSLSDAPFVLKNILTKNSAKQKVVNTDAYLKALERYPVDIISHPKRDCNIDIIEIGRAATKLGVYLEINGKRVDMTRDELIRLAEMGCEFIIGSDAHKPENIGNAPCAIKAFDEAGIPYEYAANWDRLPVFRSSLRK